MASEGIIGLDLGGTFLKYALGTPEGELLYKSKKPSHGKESRDVIFNVIFQAIDECLAQASKQKIEVAAVGCGTPGAVDFDRGKLRGNTPNLADWGNADIRTRIVKRYNLPTWVDNDANVMTLAESHCGAAAGYKTVIALTLGTGIGGGIMIDSQIYRGTHYAGAELGHITIQHDGRQCNCGGRGCIEQYASAPAMVRHYMEKTASATQVADTTINTEIIFARAAQGETAAIKTIDETCAYLGAALASIVNIFNPEIIVIGGGVAEAGEDFLGKIYNELKSRAMEPALRDLKLVPATLGNDAGMVGAIILAATMNSKDR